MRGLGCPGLPGSPFGYAGLEDEVATGADGGGERGEGAMPVLVGDDALNGIAGADGKVEGGRLGVVEMGCVTNDPGDRVASGLCPGDVDRGAGRVDADHLETTRMQAYRQGAGATAEVEYAGRLELIDDLLVDVEVVPRPVEQVVQNGESGVGVDRIGIVGHGADATVPPPGGRADADTPLPLWFEHGVPSRPQAPSSPIHVLRMGRHPGRLRDDGGGSVQADDRRPRLSRRPQRGPAQHDAERLRHGRRAHAGPPRDARTHPRAP